MWMDRFTFISKIVDGLAWPVTAVVLVLILKKPLIQIINKIKSVQSPWFTATFDAVLDGIDALGAKVEVSSSSKTTEVTPRGAIAAGEELAKIIDNPAAVIVESWGFVIAAAAQLFTVAKQLKPHPDEAEYTSVGLGGKWVRTATKAWSTRQMLDFIKEREMVSEDEWRLADELMTVRDKVAADPTLPITPNQARRFQFNAKLLHSLWYERFVKLTSDSPAVEKPEPEDKNVK